MDEERFAVFSEDEQDVLYMALDVLTEDTSLMRDSEVEIARNLIAEVRGW